MNQDTQHSMIAPCGLDCEKCNARIATINNDDHLRQETAALWSKLNNYPIKAEDVNCMGCRADGVKTYYCTTLCGIRTCALAKGFDTCKVCHEKQHCPTLAPFAEYPEVIENLDLKS